MNTRTEAVTMEYEGRRTRIDVTVNVYPELEDNMKTKEFTDDSPFYVSVVAKEFAYYKEGAPVHSKYGISDFENSKAVLSHVPDVVLSCLESVYNNCYKQFQFQVEGEKKKEINKKKVEEALDLGMTMFKEEAQYDNV